MTLKSWQAVVIFSALPLITLEVVAMGALDPKHSPFLSGGLAALSLACGAALLQVYRLRTNARAALSLALVYAMAAGSTMMVLAGH